MSTTDELLEKLFSWIKQMELCAEKLNKAVLQLESQRKNCNISECVGSTTADDKDEGVLHNMVSQVELRIFIYNNDLDEEATQVAEGAPLQVFEPREAIDNWKKLAESKDGTEASKSMRKASQDLKKITEQFQNIGYRRRVESELLMSIAMKMCRDEAVKQWMTEHFKYGAFHKLAELFNLLKNCIDEEEKKDHGDHVDIIFLAHGAITDCMVPAKCLLPLPTVEDVVLYSPWNCNLDADALFSVAAGIMKPQDRVFECDAEDVCEIPDEEHQPKNLPDRWNSMKEAGDKLVPYINLHAQKPEDRLLEKCHSFIKKHGIPERNRIFISYDLQAGDISMGSVKFHVVSLALSLVLLGRKFKATLHLPTCLVDQSSWKKLDKEYLENQYAYTIDHTLMAVNSEILKE